MKRTLAILLCAVLLLSCLPILSAGAKELDVEAKFKLLLDDLELNPNIHQSDRYFYVAMKKTDDWVLFRGGLRDLSVTDGNYRYHYAVVGNKLVYSGVNCAPFKSGYGVYDRKTGVFYDITDAWNRDFEGLRDVWNDLFAHFDPQNECGIQMIGDADLDRSLTIMDATRFQRYLAEIEYTSLLPIDPKDFYYGYPIYNALDYDRDGDFTVMDATKLQRNIADLPNVLDAKLKWDENIFDQSGEDYPETTILTSLSGLDKNREDHKMILDSYKDSFFKKHFLLVINNDTDGELEFKGASIDKDGVLNADFDHFVHEGEGSVTVRRHHFIVIELTRAFIDDIQSAKVNVNHIYPEDPSDIIATVVQKDYAKKRKSGSLPEADGYRFIESERVFNGDYGNQGSPAFDKIIADNQFNAYEDAGYIAVIKTPAQLSYLFPDRDVSAYDKKFFGQYSLVALVYASEWTYKQYLYMSHLAVKGDTLYGELDLLNPRMSLAAETIYYDVHKVKRSDVSNIEKTALWEDPMYNHGYLYDGYGQYSELPARGEYAPDDSYRRLSTADHYPATYDFENPSDVKQGSGVTKLVGLVYNPDQWRYFLKSISLPKRPITVVNGEIVPSDESEDTFEEYAYLILDYTAVSKRAHITDIFTNGVDIDVFVSEDRMAGGAASTEYSIEIVKLNKGDIQGVKNIRIWKDDVFSKKLGTLVFDDEAKDNLGAQPVGKLIGSHEELVSFAGKYMSTSAKNKINDMFCDAYFKQHLLIGAYVQLGSRGETLSLDSVVYNYDGTCDLNLKHFSEDGIGATALDPRVVLVAVGKNDYSEVKTVNVNLEWGSSYDYRPAEHPYIFVDTPPNVSKEAQLFTSRSQLNPALDGHQTLMNDYNDKFFEDNAILVVHYNRAVSGSDIVQFESLDVSTGHLCVNMLEYTPTMSSGDLKQVNYVFEVRKDFIKKTVGDPVVVHKKVDGDDASVCNTDADIRADKVAPIPTDYPNNGFTSVGFEKAYSKCMDIFQPTGQLKVYSNVLIEGDYSINNGVAAIIANPYEMENIVHDDELSNGYYYGSFNYSLDEDYDYDLKFFDDHVLVAVAVCWANYEPKLRINGLYKKDGVLYVDAEVVDDNCPPLVSHNVAFVKVKRSDLRDITSVKLAKLQPAPGSTSFNVMETHTPQMSFGSESEIVAEHITKVSEVEGVLYGTLYTANNVHMGNDGHRFAASKKTADYFDENSLIAMRVYQSSGDATLEVTGVTLEDGKLHVSVDRRHPNTPATPDSWWQMIILELPHLGLKLPVEVTVTDKLTRDPFVEDITDDKKTDRSSGGDIAFEALPTGSLSFVMSHTDADAEFLRQPYQVAVIHTYEQYRSYFSAKYFAEYDNNHHVFDHIENNSPVFLDKSFFDENALIVGVGRYSAGDTWLKFDEIKGGSGELCVRFNRYNVEDLTPGSSYEAPIIGYCFAAAKVPKTAVEQVWRIKMLPEVEKLPDEPLCAGILPDSKRQTQAQVQSTADNCRFLFTSELDKVSGNKNVLNIGYESCNFKSNGNGYFLLIRSRAEYLRHFAGLDTTFDYNDDFFDDNALLVAFGQGYSTNYEARLSDLAVVNGTQLYADARIYDPTPELAAGETAPFVWTFRSVAQSDVKDVTTLKFWKSDFLAENVDQASDHKKISEVMTTYGSQARLIDCDPVTVKTNSSIVRYDVAWDTFNTDLYLDSGVVMLIRSSASFKNHFPSPTFDSLNEYNDEFFKNYALIAMVGSGYEDTYAVGLTDPGVVGNKLYVSATSAYHPYYTKDGMQIELPSAPMDWCFLRVSKSDVDHVDTIRFWDPDSLTAGVTSCDHRPNIPGNDINADCVSGATFITRQKLFHNKAAFAPYAAADDIREPDNAGGWEYYGLSDNTYGYLYLIRTQADFERFFPGYSLVNKGSSYFNSNAIIAYLAPSYSDTTVANIDCIAVKGKTLYVKADTSGFPRFYKDGDKIDTVSSTWVTTCCRFVEVSQRDVKNVTGICVWKTPASGVSMWGKTESRVFCDTTADVNLCKDTAAIRATNRTELEAAIEALCVDADGNPVEHHYSIPESLKENSSGYYSNDVLVLRIFRGHGDTALEIPSLLYDTSTGVLHIDVMRYDLETPLLSDNEYEIRIITIPKLVTDEPIDITTYTNTVPYPVDPEYLV